MTYTDLEKLRQEATPGDLDSAEIKKHLENMECPTCGGPSEFEADDYCNFDGVALGVQFYGIGPEHQTHEKLWREMLKQLPSLLLAAQTLAKLRSGEVVDGMMLTKARLGAAVGPALLVAGDDPTPGLDAYRAATSRKDRPND